MSTTSSESPGESAGSGTHHHDVPRARLLGVPRRALALALLTAVAAMAMFTLLLLRIGGLVDQVLAASEQTERLAERVQAQSDTIEELSQLNGQLITRGVQCLRDNSRAQGDAIRAGQSPDMPVPEPPACVQFREAADDGPVEAPG